MENWVYINFAPSKCQNRFRNEVLLILAKYKTPQTKPESPDAGKLSSQLTRSTNSRAKNPKLTAVTRGSTGFYINVSQPFN